MAKDNAPRVAILVDTSTGWGRRVIRGVIGYTRKFEHWNLSVQARGQDEPMRLSPGWRGDGIIARISDHHSARHVAAAKASVVNVSGIELPGVDFCRVTTDLRMTGRLAAEHLVDRGLKNFAYAALSRFSYVQHQYQGFADTLTQAGGYSCPSYQPGARPVSRSEWLAQQRELARWLRKLPKPVGILAWATALGSQLIDICHEIGLSVPEDVAILGGDDDELMCETCSPSLSGVAVPSEQIGYEAAALLDRLMRGEDAGISPLFVVPHGVVARQSTDILAIDDDDVAEAIRFIRDHASKPMEVEDVLRAVAISRRRLERGFHKILGRSPAAEIRRCHLDRAKQLLTGTDMSIPDVADASGFGCSTYFAYIFKREVGQSPLKYRSTTRAR